MCSVQEDDVPLRKADPDMRLHRVCMKCKTEDAILITRVNDAFCRACFQVYVTHKFRAAIGKTKLVRDGERVLVAYSGGPSSSALLSLIHEGLSQRAHKKLRFKPGLIFIDEGAAVGLSTEERIAICDNVQRVLQQFGFPYYIKALEEGMDLDAMLKTLPAQPAGPVQDVVADSNTNTDIADCDVIKAESSGTLPSESSHTACPANRDEENCVRPGLSSDAQRVYQTDEGAEKLLKSTLDGIKSVSAKEDFICSLRQKILLEIARHCGYSKVMLGSSGTQLAVKLLTNISTGRGKCAAMEAAFADRRHGDILFLRPLRDFSSKEVAIYNNLHNVDTVFIPTLTTKADKGVSIEHLTESFVTGLQADFPSTVSNIMRTGEKLDSSKEKAIEKQCTLCQGPLDTDVGASSALSAVEFSQQISRGKLVVDKGDNCSQTTECCGEGDGSCQSSKPSKPSSDEVISSLCYGCRIVVKEMDDVYRLPEFVIENVAKKNRRSKMKSEIEEFLIQES